MVKKILVDVDLGLKGVEKTDVLVYGDKKLIGVYDNRSYDDLKNIADEFRMKFPDAELEVWCNGESACGGTSGGGRIFQWKVEV